jgi:hypothetical protein
MIHNQKELEITLMQMNRLIDAMGSLKDEVLDKNPRLFAVMAESYLDQLAELRGEIDEFLSELKKAG